MSAAFCKLICKWSGPMIFLISMLVIPALLILLSQRVSVLDKIGVVVLAFGLGFVIALIGGDSLSGVRNTQTTVSEVAVALALPLILFSANLAKALRDARQAVLAMGLALVSVAVASIVGALVFSDAVADIWQVAGMAVGAYTGSGVNLAAVKTAIGGSEDVFLTMVTYDIVFSALFMLVVLSLGQRLAGLVLPAYVPKGDGGADSALAHLASDSARDYNVLVARAHLAGLLIALLASALCVGAAVLLSSLLPETVASTATILLITTFGLLGSFVPALHKIKASFHLGMYFILIFCLTSATMLDTSIFVDMDWSLGGYFLSLLIGAMIVLALLCRLFGIDRDTYLIAAGASVMSVPFIPVIAGALKNRELLVPGIAIAIIGYAVGNYLGVIIAHTVQAMTGV